MTSPAHSPGDCGKVGEILGRFGDRWTLLVIVALRDRPLRFNEARRKSGGISQQMLTRTLKALERDGMVTRTVFPTVPPSVEYGLTGLGRSLAEVALAVGAWALEHLPEIERHRSRYDQSALGR